MNLIRRALGGLFAILGAYYCIVSVRTLATLPRVTAHWIERSGDPDFKYDYGTFMLWLAMGAVLVGVLGCRTATKGVRAALGRRESWLAIAIGAPFLHSFWFLYRVVGNGLLDREARRIADRSNLVRFGFICLAYFVMWVVMRRRNPASGPVDDRTNPTRLSNAHAQIADAATSTRSTDGATLLVSHLSITETRA